MINYLNYDLEIDQPIYINDYECLEGLNLTKLTNTFKELQAEVEKRGIEKIGLIIDIDNDSETERLKMVNQCLTNVFGDVEKITNTGELIKIPILGYDMEIEFACYFTNVDGQGELETVLKAIKTKDSAYADCLEDWKNCLKKQQYTITDKQFDKFWISIYLRYDTCSNSEQKQAGRKCSMSGFEYIMQNKREIWDFTHPILDDLKGFLYLFEPEN